MVVAWDYVIMSGLPRFHMNQAQKGPRKSLPLLAQSSADKRIHDGDLTALRFDHG